MTYQNHHYNKSLKAKARQLRTKSFSKAEKRIWKQLLSRKQTGVRFLRQRPMDSYIVDFFAPEIGLVIEIDGSSHYSRGTQDAWKENRLEELGYKILRLSEGEVLNNIEEVRLTINHAIYCLGDKLS